VITVDRLDDSGLLTDRLDDSGLLTDRLDDSGLLTDRLDDSGLLADPHGSRSPHASYTLPTRSLPSPSFQFLALVLLPLARSTFVRGVNFRLLLMFGI